jgi:DNA-directed RNA polymerase subunit H (RpoH/RPB5)
MLIILCKNPHKMHILQSKHSKLSEKDTEELLKKLNISKSQLPKILSSDTGLPDGCVVEDVIKIERKDAEPFFRVVV